LILYGTCGDLQCQTASGIEASMSSENLARKTALEEKVATALELMLTRATFEDGVALLKQAAHEGSDEARYRLGSFYMQGVVVKADYDEALEYLQRVNGEFRTSASILIGVIRAEGSKKLAPDLKIAAKIFDEAATALRAQMEGYIKSPPSSDLTSSSDLKELTKDMERRHRLYNDWLVLRGYADKYGIRLNQLR
jgi:TPR repeat protein